MNPKYKERVKVELDHILDAGIIEPIKESEWIGPIVIQDKETTDKVRIYVDLRKLNDACLHDPFPISFTNEVLECFGWKEMYSFTDGFSRYHQVRIMKEDYHKMTFITEWGCYQYMIMPFGLKNAPAILSTIVVSAFKYFILKFLEVYFDDWTVFVLVRDHV